jgi:threonyl-tRNA synthetase
MIHRALLGSIERFMGVLIEHYAGKFPLWISPVQVRILTIADRFNSYAHKIADKYSSEGIRVEVDDRAESVSYKVREAELDRINYILVVGEKEIKNSTVTVRTRENKILGAVKAERFLQQLLKEVSDKE